MSKKEYLQKLPLLPSAVRRKSDKSFTMEKKIICAQFVTTLNKKKVEKMKKVMRVKAHIFSTLQIARSIHINV